MVVWLMHDARGYDPANLDPATYGNHRRSLQIVHIGNTEKTHERVSLVFPTHTEAYNKNK